MLIMGKGNGLPRFGHYGLILSTPTLNKGETPERKHAGESSDQPVLFHVEATALWQGVAPLKNRAQGGFFPVTQGL